MLKTINNFLKRDSASGMLLMAAALLALIAANSPFDYIYRQLISLQLTVSVEDFEISKPILLWINDGLMALFFLLVGLELKREVLAGDLNSPQKIMLPAFAAVGGMLIPALLYVSVNWGNATALQGWAIPTATDIAFALGILLLLGDRVPAALKVFLVSLAIFDDLGAIVIIALFYTENLSIAALSISACGLTILFAMNRSGVVNNAAYLIVGIVIWVATLKSGVHATLAGVAIALFIPMSGRDVDGHEKHPLHDLEHDLHTPVNNFILPIFAFANAGLSFSGLSFSSLIAPIPLGIILGLFVGKQLGVMSMVWLAIKLKLGKMPDNVNWRHIYGIAVLCGVGFTMSLFIGTLAFEQSGLVNAATDRLGILVGSLLSGIWAYVWLRYFCDAPQKESEASQSS